MSDKEIVSVNVDGQAVTCKKGQTLLRAVLDAGLLIDTACGGMGSCHLCRVRIVEGGERLPAPRRAEKRALGNVLIADGVRLSCQITPQTPLTLELFEPRTAKTKNKL